MTNRNIANIHARNTLEKSYSHRREFRDRPCDAKRSGVNGAKVYITGRRQADWTPQCTRLVAVPRAIQCDIRERGRLSATEYRRLRAVKL